MELDYLPSNRDWIIDRWMPFSPHPADHQEYSSWQGNSIQKPEKNGKVITTAKDRSSRIKQNQQEIPLSRGRCWGEDQSIDHFFS